MSVVAAGLTGVISANESDLYLSFLPLPHIFERVIVNCLMSSGAAVGFYRGDILKLVEDIGALQPTIFCAVPRLYTRIHDRFNTRVASSKGVEGYMLRMALSTKLRNLRARGVTKHRVWDSLVFMKAKKAMGLQNVRLMVSGGAPLPVGTMEVSGPPSTLSSRIMLFCFFNASIILWHVTFSQSWQSSRILSTSCPLWVFSHKSNLFVLILKLTESFTTYFDFSFSVFCSAGTVRATRGTDRRRPQGPRQSHMLTTSASGMSGVLFPAARSS